MEQRKTLNEVLDDLVAAGNLTETQADDIVSAPRVSFSMRELVSYLGSLIVMVGVIRIIAVAFEDASALTVSVSLYLLAALTGGAAWRLSGGSSVIKRRLAEVLELASIGSAAGATAIALNEANMKGEWIATLITATVLLWGLFRSSKAMFAGTVALSVGAPGLAISLAALINGDSASLAGGLMLLAACALVLLGLNTINAAYIARAVGALFVIISSMILGNELRGCQFIPIVTGAVLFTLGVVMLLPEMLLAGSFCVIAGIVLTVTHYIDNDMAQGLVIIATGLAVLGTMSVQMRRVMKRPMTGAPIA